MATEEPAGSQPGIDTSRRRRRLWFTAAVVALGLVAAEILVRVAVPPARLLRLAQLDKALAGGQRHQFLSVIRDDPETFWRFAPNVELPVVAGHPFFGRISNGQGLREAREIPVPKPQGTLRILFLGDSCTFGYLLAESETFVAMAQERLRTRFPAKKIECINGGVPGYTAFQCWRRLETEGYQLEPDLVVVQSGWNESIVWDGRSDPEHYRALQRSRPPGLLAWSQLCRLLWTWARWPEPVDDGRARLAPAEFRRVLSRVGESLDGHGVGFLLLVTGCRQNVRAQSLTTLQAEQLQFARSRSFGGDDSPAFVNGVTRLTELTLQQGRPVETYLFDEAHPTKVYNEILAAELVARIAPWIEKR